MSDNGEQQLLLKIIKEQPRISKKTAETLLENKGLHHSSKNWDDLIERRFLPALENEEISTEDLIEVWRSAESWGGGHIFLYRQTRPVRRLRSADLPAAPLVVYRPQTPQLVDLRLQPNGDGNNAVARVEETRLYKRRSWVTKGGVTYQQEQTREIWALDLVRWHPVGILELQLQSHPSWASDPPSYDSLERAVWKVIGHVLPRDHFDAIDLGPAKINLWQDRLALSDRARIVRVECADDPQTTLLAASGKAMGGRRSRALTADPEACAALDAFLGGSGYFRELDFWWGDVAISMSGEAHELSVGQGCSEHDYKQLFETIVSHV